MLATMDSSEAEQKAVLGGET